MTTPIIKISAYKAWKNRPGCKPYDTDFYTEMDRIKTGYYKDIADQYRSMPDGENRKQYKIDNLPSLTISAVCRDWRKSENVVNHTGLLNLDIDKKSNLHVTDWPALRDQIFGMRGVVASFLSVSGEGVTFVVKIKPEYHKDAFFSIVDGMKQHMGINVDPGLHDIVRLRFVSDDPGAKIRYNYDEIPLSEPSEHYLSNKKNFGVEQSTLEPIGEADSEYNFNEAVKKAEQLYKFSDGQKWSFLVSVSGSCNVMGMSLQFCRSMVLQRYRAHTNISNERLVSPVEQIYKLYKNQHGTFHQRTKSERLNYRITQHLIFQWVHKGIKPNDNDRLQMCETYEADRDRVDYITERVFAEYDNEFGYEDFPTVKKIQIWLEKRYKLRRDIVTMQSEICYNGTGIYETINPDEIYRQIQLAGFKYSLDNIKSLMRSAFVKSHDPILDYFKGTIYDGEDHISHLASYIETDNSSFWFKQFKKSLVRSIPCGLGKKENRIVMVLHEPDQETGKSTYIRFLSPFPEGKYFTESPIVGGNQKDTEIRFSENFIYNIEELSGLNRADVQKLKADISKAIIKERRPHGYFEIAAPRRCNFWASTNQKEFLHDDQNTRWLIFNVTKVMWDYRANVDINKVWGQAWYLFNNGFDYELDREDKVIRDTVNEEYRYRRSEEELIARYFKPAKERDGKFMSSTEIAMYLNGKSPSLKINGNNIGKTMKAIFGLESVVVKINGQSVRGYWLHTGFTEAEGEHRFIVPGQDSASEMPF